MSDTHGYVGAYYDWASDKVIVWERSESGRNAKTYDAPKYFYVPDENGAYTSIYKDTLKRLDFDTQAEFKAAINSYRNKFESDISPLFKVLMDDYYGVKPAAVHYALLDIEWNYRTQRFGDSHIVKLRNKKTATAGELRNSIKQSAGIEVWDEVRGVWTQLENSCYMYTGQVGWSSTSNPYAEINGLTIWQSWTKRYKVYAVPPPDLSFDELTQEKYDFGESVDYQLCRDEYTLLTHLVEDIQSADIISGWNSEFADLPYIIKRLERVAPKLLNKMSFIGCPPPKEGTTEKYGTEEVTYRMFGRSHIDYLSAFQKFTFSGRTSYSLENIANEELDIPKMHYDGTLEELYHGTHRPSVFNVKWEDTRDMDKMAQLNTQRELIRKELEKRGLAV